MNFKLQQIIERFRRKRGGYKKAPLQPRNNPVQRNRSVLRGNRVARIKHWLVTRDQRAHKGFKPSRKKRNIKFRIMRLAAVSCIVMLFISFEGIDKVKDSLHSISLFQIDSLEIRGNSIVSNNSIREASGIIALQTSMLEISSDDIESKLEKVSWVASAEVRKNWPSSIVIEVKENVPLALVDQGDTGDHQLYYIDKFGISFLPVKPGGAVDFPVITGLPSITDTNTRKHALTDALIFLQKVRRNDPHLPAHSVSEVHVNGKGELVVYLVEYPFPIFFGNGNTKRKYGRLVEVLKALYKNEDGEQLISRIEYIQMDYQQDKVLVAQTGSG